MAPHVWRIKHKELLSRPGVKASMKQAFASKNKIIRDGKDF